VKQFRKRLFKLHRSSVYNEINKNTTHILWLP